MSIIYLNIFETNLKNKMCKGRKFFLFVFGTLVEVKRLRLSQNIMAQVKLRL